MSAGHLAVVEAAEEEGGDRVRVRTASAASAASGASVVAAVVGVVAVDAAVGLGVSNQNLLTW